MKIWKSKGSLQEAAHTAHIMKEKREELQIRVKERKFGGRGEKIYSSMKWP